MIDKTVNQMQQTGTKGTQEHISLHEERDPLRIMQKTDIDHADKLHMQPPKKHTLLWDLDIQTDHPMLARRPKLVLN